MSGDTSNSRNSSLGLPIMCRSKNFRHLVGRGSGGLGKGPGPTNSKKKSDIYFVFLFKSSTYLTEGSSALFHGKL